MGAIRPIIKQLRQIPSDAFVRILQRLGQDLCQARKCHETNPPNAESKGFPHILYQRLFWLCQMSSDCFDEQTDAWTNNNALSDRFADLMLEYKALLEEVIARSDISDEVLLSSLATKIQDAILENYDEPNERENVRHQVTADIRDFLSHTESRLDLLEKMAMRREEYRHTSDERIMAKPIFDAAPNNRLAPKEAPISK